MACAGVLVIKLPNRAYLVIHFSVCEALESHEALINYKLAHCAEEAFSEVDLHQTEGRTWDLGLMHIPIHDSQKVSLIC